MSRRELARSWLTPLLSASGLGIYALVIVGATVSLADGAEACGTWPSCHGQWLVPPGDPLLAVTMAHRVLALGVGLLLAVTTAMAWLASAPRSIRALVSLVAVLYPVQVGFGALTAISGGSNPYPLFHLALAMAIFGGVLIATVRWLERETADVAPSFDDSQRSRRDEGTGSEGGEPGIVRAYLSLTKPRLMWLLCFVAIAGIALASASTGQSVGPTVVAGTLFGGVLAIGASGTFNHVLEHDVDREMARTADRPTATDTIPLRNATAFGFALAAASLVVFLALVNPVAAALGLGAIFFYSVIYTVVLKPHTDQNIVIGGAVGAFPALIGWAAVTGTVGVPALVLGLLIFLWTPAHFYNLALAYKPVYERGGFPRLPIARDEGVTLRHITWYFGATLLSAVLLGLVAPLGILYALTVVVFAGVFLRTVVDLYRDQTPRVALRTFHASNAFLGAVMLVIVIDAAFL